MGQLTTSDTGFLGSSGGSAPDRHASLAIGAVAVVDGAVPDYQRFKALLADRIKSVPQCTSPQFDVTHHVRRVALPRPGDEAELFRAIAHALERPLDPDRPLWECWVIEGLNGNQWAILMKIHSRMADSGISAAHILTRLCDDADSDTFANHVGAKPVSHIGTPSWADALWPAAAGKVAGNLAANVAGNVAGNVAKAVGSAVEAILPWARTAWSAPATPVTMRQYHTVRVPIAAVDRVCRRFGVTSNDVALAAVTEGFRTVLLHRGEQPRADSLRTLSALLPYLPVDHEDPVQQLRMVHNRLKAKPSAEPQPGLLESALGYLPSALRSPAIQLLARLPQRATVTLATNVPGPRHRLQLMGQRMERVLPIPPTALQLSTGVAVLSYGDELVFGITADYDAAPDVKRLADGIELGMARLVALSQPSVLLFTKDRRRRSSRAFRPSTPYARARR
jgi:diacylglycerol O-acyltransferase / wax synthase